MSDMKKTNPIRYKLFWNWDHSTNWCLNTLGTQNCGVGNLYTKRSGEFVTDFTRAVDWASANGIDAIGCVGLLRDAHGGWESARRVCAYARERGVRIYIIAGLYAYGGIYYEGDSPFSLDRFLRNHPECMALGPDAMPRYIQFSPPFGNKCEPTACPSNPTVRNFVLDSIDYLFQAIPELGGIQMETGDSSLCRCEACRARRREQASGEGRLANISFSDMTDIYPEAGEVIRSRSADAWVICEMYTHFRHNPACRDFNTPAWAAMAKMPDNTFLQWSDRRLDWEAWAKSPALPEPLRRFRNIFRCHHGTQWDGGRHTLAVEEIRRQCRLSCEAGIQGVSIFGECSPFHTHAECNYLALQYFAGHPQDSLREFAENVMAPRLGGTALAEAYMQFGYLNREPEKIPAAMVEIAGIIAKLKEPGALRRWCWLVGFLNAYHWEYRHENGRKTDTRINLDIL